MIRRKHKRQPLDGVQINLAAMLDMAFQLLAFFILTFKPQTIEQMIALHLPPPKDVRTEAANTKKPDPNDPVVESLTTLRITVGAQPNGTLGSVSLEGAPFPNLAMFGDRLKGLLNAKDNPFEQIIMEVAPELKHEEMMKVVDVCLNQKFINKDGKVETLSKISFLPTKGK